MFLPIKYVNRASFISHRMTWIVQKISVRSNIKWSMESRVVLLGSWSIIIFTRSNVGHFCSARGYISTNNGPWPISLVYIRSLPCFRILMPRFWDTYKNNKMKTCIDKRHAPAPHTERKQLHKKRRDAVPFCRLFTQRYEKGESLVITLFNWPKKHYF